MYVYAVQNVPERPHWSDAELPAILRGLLAEFGGVLGRARDQIREPEQKPGAPNEDAVGVIAASYRALAKPV